MENDDHVHDSKSRPSNERRRRFDGQYVYPPASRVRRKGRRNETVADVYDSRCRRRLRLESFWDKPSSILPITPEQLEFARAYVSEHVGDKIPAVQKDYIESAKTHAEHVQRARALMDAMKRPERVAFHADFATKFFGATATPPEKADESMEVFQARGKSPAPAKPVENAEEKKAASTTAEPERSKKVDDAVLLIARTFVAMQKQALPIKTALGNAWVGETIRGVVGPLMLSNKDRAELIKLLGG